MRVVLQLALPALLALGCLAARADGPHVDVATVRGVIDVVNAQYLSRSLDHAAADGAEALVVQMDTPGGTDTSMRAMIQKMLSSTVPVVVYVSPSGARAGSAGVFITLAADVAAMAPNTNIGAAHPVTPGQQLDATMEAKLTNDAAALARTLAARRGHNEAWAEKAVRESASLTEREALDSRVVDVIAADLPDLLAQLDGRTVALAGGSRTLHTRGAALRTIDLTIPEQAMHTLIDPNIAYMLLSLGMWALIAEFYHPGTLIPGLTGVVCLVLAFVALESLPMNWGGLGLLALAMILFVADVKAPTHGVLTVGGVICFVLGSLMLFTPFSPAAPELPEVRVSPYAIAGVTALLVAFFAVAVQAGIRAQRRPAAFGSSTLLGAVGTAHSELKPGGPRGSVQMGGELWTAVSDGEAIAPGDRVEVVGAEGLRLRVRKSRT